MAHAINWFEIPSADFERAVTFYNTILDTTLHKELFNGRPNAIFQTGEDQISGAIVQNNIMQPSSSGAIVYLNADNQIEQILQRIEPAGGQIVLPRTSIGDPGWIALFIDSEGNQVGLHSPV